MADFETVRLLALVAALLLPFRPTPPPLEMFADFAFAGLDAGKAMRGQNKSCSKSYAKTERSGNVMQRGGFFQEVAMA